MKMPKVEDIKILNIDEKPYTVDSLGPQVKELIDIYNEWNGEEAELRSKLMVYQAAKETLSQQIMTKAREHLDEAAKAAEPAPEVVPATDKTTD